MDLSRNGLPCLTRCLAACASHVSCPHILPPRVPYRPHTPHEAPSGRCRVTQPRQISPIWSLHSSINHLSCVTMNGAMATLTTEVEGSLMWYVNSLPGAPILTVVLHSQLTRSILPTLFQRTQDHCAHRLHLVCTYDEAQISATARLADHPD